MGGYRFNGCGATDHFKKIKSLGIHLCPRCKKETEFFLEEAKFKIDVFFIPTVTLKSRFAVMCGKCKQGEVCSDQWAANLINSNGPFSVIFESRSQQAAQIQTPEQSIPYTPPENVTGISPEPAVRRTATKVGTPPSFFKCPHCGVTQLREGAFCSFCGKLVPEDPNVPSLGQGEEYHDGMNTCPVCGNRQKNGMKFCSNCGHPMETPPSTECVCPNCGAKIEGTAAFCMECGTKL